jgi:hypothetical protein
MPTIGGDNGVSMGGYDYGVATLKYCYISAGSKRLTKLVPNVFFSGLKYLDQSKF